MASKFVPYCHHKPCPECGIPLESESSTRKHEIFHRDIDIGVVVYQCPAFHSDCRFELSGENARAKVLLHMKGHTEEENPQSYRLVMNRDVVLMVNGVCESEASLKNMRDKCEFRVLAREHKRKERLRATEKKKRKRKQETIDPSLEIPASVEWLLQQPAYCLKV